MRLKTTLVGLVLFLNVAAAFASDPIEELRCTEVAFSRSVETGDQESFAGFIEADARFIASSTLRGREAVLEGWSVFFAEDAPRLVWRPEAVELRDDGLGLSRGPYRMAGVDEQGEAYERWGRYNSVWKRDEDGRWRIIFDFGSDTGMTPTPEQRALLEADPGCGAGAPD